MVQADGGLVENVEHAAQLGADLCRQANALAFAAGERCRRAIERDIAEAHGVEKLEALADLMQHAAGDGRSRSLSWILPATSTERETGSAVKSEMESPFTFTPTLSGRSRLPRQTGQTVADM